MNTDYKQRAYEILCEMAFYLKHCDRKEKNEFYNSKLENIKNFIDCTDLIQRFKEVTKNETN